MVAQGGDVTAQDVEDEVKRSQDELKAEFGRILAPFLEFLKGLKGNDMIPLGGKDVRFELKTLRSEVDLLKQMGGSGFGQAAAGYNPTLGMNAMNLGSMPGSASTPLSTGGINPQAAFLSRIKLLEERMKSVENQLAEKSVTIGGVTFTSPGQAHAWLQLNAPGSGSYIYFLDASSLLTLADAQVAAEGVQEFMSFEAATSKAGYKTAEEAAIATSFKMELPPFFGKDHKPTKLVKDVRRLPAIPTYEVWNPRDGHNGAMYAMATEIKAARDMMMLAARETLPDVAAALAGHCLQESQQFITAMGDWMSTEYQGMMDKFQAQSLGKKLEPTVSAECWRLISASVRALFQDLHNARKAGRGPFASETLKAQGRLWGNLQGIRVMREYVQENFSAHPKMSHVLHCHIRDQAVMRTEFDEVVKELRRDIGKRKMA
jgi:hypothetical protein